MKISGPRTSAPAAAPSPQESSNATKPKDTQTASSGGWRPAAPGAARSASPAPKTKSQEAIADMKQNAEDYQRISKASSEIQTSIGMAQTQAQTVQTAVGGAKASSRPH